MKIVIGNYPKPEDSRNLILNDKVVDYKTGDTLSSLYALITRVEGLETPPYRNVTGDWSGADGGYISSQFYGARSITISGAYIDNRAGCDLSYVTSEQFDRVARMYIRSRLPIRTELGIRIFLDNGMVFSTRGYCTDLKMDYENIRYGEYMITMYCPDPGLHKTPSDGILDTDWMIAELYKEKAVGYENPYEMKTGGAGVLGAPEWTTGGRTSPVEYLGDIPYYPRIIIHGPVTNPSLYHVESDRTFSLGFPSERMATGVVATMTSTLRGMIGRVEVLSGGSYPDDYSANNIPVKVISTTGATTGTGATFNVRMTQSSDGTWAVSEIVTKTGGLGYTKMDELTFLIPGASPLDVSTGQLLTIDMQNRSVDVDGVSKSYAINTGSSWFALSPMKVNHIQFTSDDEGSPSASVQWRNSYSGI